MSLFKVVVPARFASSRLPGKPLLPLAGKPMILHVVQRAADAGAEEVIVATDDGRIAEVVSAAGFDVCMTAPAHLSGTDRIAEVAAQRAWDPGVVIVNLQGDEPLMPSSLLRQVAKNLAAHEDAAMATLATPIRQRAMLFDPHVVKVVLDEAGYACYFSRAPIPWHRDEFLDEKPGERASLPAGVPFLRHIGLYAYRTGFLQQYVTWKPAVTEMAESLEQLRALWHGQRIHVGVVADQPGHGVDTADDLRRVEAILQTQAG